MYVCVYAGLSVFLSGVTLAVSIGNKEGGLVFEGHNVGLADVHPVLLSLQVLVVAFVFVIVLGFAVVGGGVARQCWRWGHGGWSGVAEAGRLRADKTTFELLGFVFFLI